MESIYEPLYNVLVSSINFVEKNENYILNQIKVKLLGDNLILYNAYFACFEFFFFFLWMDFLKIKLGFYCDKV